jgi:SAM-dependent methyltransferase
MKSGDQNYLFDHTRRSELTRLRALATVCDPWTTSILERIDPRPGWRCLDVGSGAGSIALWLAQRVGPAGYVVATDISTVFLEPLASASLHVRRHDILTGPVENQAFDLVHARFLLEWLSDWQTGLTNLVESVKPGGVIVLSDIAWHSRPASPQPIEALLTAFPVVMQQRSGWDLDCGRELADRLALCSVRDVQAEIHAARVNGGTAGADWPRLSIVPVRDALIQLGGMDEATLQHATIALADPSVAFWLPPMISARGTRQD